MADVDRVYERLPKLQRPERPATEGLVSHLAALAETMRLHRLEDLKRRHARSYRHAPKADRKRLEPVETRETKVSALRRGGELAIRSKAEERSIDRRDQPHVEKSLSTTCQHGHRVSRARAGQAEQEPSLPRPLDRDQHQRQPHHRVGGQSVLSQAAHHHPAVSEAQSSE